MSEAPERIWAERDRGIYWTPPFSDLRDDLTEYTRTDCIPNDPRVKALVEAATRLMRCFPDPCYYDHHGRCQEHFIEDECSVAALNVALAAMEPRHE